jgi:putative ubiquitin-RnfH superfamily antitoxin RatB of RatAB toxin-antitoxin module
MKFEVAYGRMDEQALVTVESVTPLSVLQAIERSGILQHFPEIDLAAYKVGIFGKAAKLDTELSEGDRVEIYRPLIADPKEARKKRAAQGKAMRKGGG